MDLDPDTFYVDGWTPIDDADEDNPFEIGDRALHRNNQLDSRPVIGVLGDEIAIQIGTLGAWVTAEDYERISNPNISTDSPHREISSEEDRMSRPEISKTTITFTVLHRTGDEGLVEAARRDYDHFLDSPLGYVLQESWDGGMVGLESDPITVPVPDGQVGAELIALGNDGTFFDDQED
jgi:hypothetical protein